MVKLRVTQQRNWSFRTALYAPHSDIIPRHFEIIPAPAPKKNIKQIPKHTTWIYENEMIDVSNKVDEVKNDLMAFCLVIIHLNKRLFCSTWVLTLFERKMDMHLFLSVLIDKWSGFYGLIVFETCPSHHINLVNINHVPHTQHTTRPTESELTIRYVLSKYVDKTS